MSLDELQAVGVTPMTDEEVNGFLATQGVGVLGLPAEDVPYLVPLSFGFDGDAALYFSYVVGAESTKRDLTEQAGRVRFLVYKAPSKFSWQSVTLTGTLTEVPESDWDEIEEPMRNAWHPDVFESADLSGGVSVYRFDIDERVGYKQTGLPPGFEAP